MFLLFLLFAKMFTSIILSIIFRNLIKKQIYLLLHLKYLENSYYAVRLRCICSPRIKAHQRNYAFKAFRCDICKYIACY